MKLKIGSGTWIFIGIGVLSCAQTGLQLVAMTNSIFNQYFVRIRERILCWGRRFVALAWIMSSYVWKMEGAGLAGE
jgi:hypothetical protein